METVHNKGSPNSCQKCLCRHAGVIGGVVAFTVAHVAKLVLDWLAAKTGCCATAADGPPLEAADDFHVTPNGDAKPPPPATTAPVSFEPFIFTCQQLGEVVRFSMGEISCSALRDLWYFQELEVFK